MKKLLFFLLSVVLIGSVGCGSNRDLSTEVTDAGSTEVVNETSEPTTEVATVETEYTKTAQPQSTEAVTEADSSSDKKDTGKDNRSDNIASEEKTADNKQSEEKSSDSQKSENQSKDKTSEPASEQQPKPEENSKPEEKPEPKPEPQAVSYSPDRVVSLAISKCQAGGMVTTEQHLKDNLNAGKITQEEYDEYYPLDGLDDSYYSVFVNVDLNKAATTSGRALGSEEEIAQYITDMLLLESDSVFNIRYTGITKTSGETFYEFRCYR